MSALWFIAGSAAVLALVWAIPLLYDTIQANRWRSRGEGPLIGQMIEKGGKMTVEEIRQIASALDTQPRGVQGLTQSLIGLIIATFVGFAMIATLVSTSSDSGDLRKTIITALLSILATIAGFYFGARTAQTSTEQATRPPQARTPAGPKSSGGPKITGINPDRGPAGEEVKLTGSGLQDATAVQFGDSRANIMEDRPRTSTEISVLSPAGVVGETVTVLAITPEGKSEPSDRVKFTYTTGMDSSEEVPGKLTK